MHTPPETPLDNLTLDPINWQEMRALGYQMVDDMMNYMQHLREEPVWKPLPENVKDFFTADIPQEGQTIEEVYADFKKFILPYGQGNIHPRFFGWIQGGGTPLAALADFLAGTMNSNASLADHSARYIDHQVVQWCKQLLNYPDTASGLLVSGSSMANTTAITVARNHQISEKIRENGLRSVDGQMTIYCSSETHSCMQKAVEILGLGTDALRKIPVNSNYEIQLDQLIQKIDLDIQNGDIPFCIVANAGTVNTGAIDPLEELAKICKKYNLWFHIDGAYGVLAKLDPTYSDQLKAVELADSIAFDLHKWLHTPYAVGCVLIKDKQAHFESFNVTPDYLIQKQRGIAGGLESTNNYGFELSREFKALKVWMSLKEHGTKKFAQVIQKSNMQAQYLSELVQKNKNLELLAPVSLSIVCFRFKNDGLSENRLNDLNKEIVIQLQEKGIAAPSSTILNGKYAIRACVLNHRTNNNDLDVFIWECCQLGEMLIAENNF